MKVFALMQKFCSDDEGVTAIEYGLIAALVGVAIIGGATLLGTNLDALFAAIAAKVATVTSGV
jgi:pilus assembly protein Flp/PilA